MFCQRTIKGNVRLEGVGLHSGAETSVTLCPAPAGTGIVFISDGARIPASYEHVTDTALATTISNGGASVRTIEHLMAALAGLSIDNLYVEVTGGEVPIMDGSAWPFVKAVREAGIVVQPAPRRYLKVIRTISVEEGGKTAEVRPSNGTEFSCRIDFAHEMLSDQNLSMEMRPGLFEDELASARTFGFLKDVQTLRRHGFALGGSLENAVVLDDGRVLNEEGLRYPDEFVRHKMLDAVGDISLLGMPIIGHVVSDRSGHRLNHLLVREIAANPDCWMIVEGVSASREAGAVKAVCI